MEDQTTDTGMDTGSEEIDTTNNDMGYEEGDMIVDDNMPDSNEQPQEEVEYSDEDINAAMMEYMRDNFELPDKFKDVGALINSYKHLEGRMGSFKGAPDEYSLEESISSAYSPEMLSGLSDVAKEMGLDNDGMSRLLTTANELQKEETTMNWEIEKGKIGSHADQELNDAVQYFNANFTPEVSQTLQGMVQTADQFRALQTAIVNAGPSRPAANINTNNQPSESNLNEMLNAKDSHGNYKMETDPTHAKKVNAMMSQQWS